MKNLFLLCLSVISSLVLSAQKDSSDNYVKNFMNIPLMQVPVLPDSSLYTNANIRKHAPFVLMFFNPDCDHCQKETKELLAYKDELKNIQILMVSASTLSEIRDFYETYQLSSMPNISMGRDIQYRLGSIYKLRTYPSIFVYDSSGALAKAFVGNIGIPAILDAVK